MGKFFSSESLFEELQLSKDGEFTPSDSLLEDMYLAGKGDESNRYEDQTNSIHFLKDFKFLLTHKKYFTMWISRITFATANAMFLYSKKYKKSRGLGGFTVLEVS